MSIYAESLSSEQTPLADTAVIFNAVITDAVISIASDIHHLLLELTNRTVMPMFAGTGYTLSNAPLQTTVNNDSERYAAEEQYGAYNEVEITVDDPAGIADNYVESKDDASVAELAALPVQPPMFNILASPPAMSISDNPVEMGISAMANQTPADDIKSVDDDISDDISIALCRR